MALDGVSFEVKRGEVIGIIGRNGAGKSTLLKILTRITAPTRGTIRLRGRVASLLEVGTGFHPELTGRENIYLNGAILGMTRAETHRKLAEIVDFAELSQFVDTPVKRYSSGMYVRLAFAVAAHLEPEILLIDEVLAVGDVAFQKKCMGRIGDVARGGRTVLFVSHNLAAVSSLCGRAILLRDGKLQEEGETSSVVNAYLAGFSALTSTQLADRKDRVGSGGARALDLDVRSMDADDVIRCGSRLKVRLRYRSDAPIRRPSVVISVNDLARGRMLLLRTDTDAGFPGEIAAEGEIECETGPINLTPGRCYVNLAIFRAGTGGSGDMLDHVENAAEFEVEASAFYPSGALPGRDWVLSLVEQRWSVRAAR
jgi:lipopolysaccharide transport system ATP-binding protein